MIIQNPFEILDKYFCLPVSSLTTDDWNILDYFTHHTDYEVRLYLSEVLSHLCCSKSEKLLVKMLDDSENLVVASVCDALSFSDSKQVLDELKKRTKSSFFIVRGYSYMSIGEMLNRKGIEKDELAYFIDAIKIENSLWVKASIAYALCLNGFCSTNIIYIVNLLNNRYYNYRIYAINLIDSLLTKPITIDCQEVLPILLLRKETENNRVVYNKIISLIEKMTC